MPSSLPSCFSRDMFVRALNNDSTAPDHILISIQEGSTGPKTLRCVEVPFFLGALHTQLGLGYEEAQTAEVLRVAVSSFGHDVTLTKRKAIRNVSADYSPSDLDAARTAVAALPRSARYDYYAINRLLGYRPDSTHKLPRQAVAHALIEQGIMVTRGCIGGDLNPHR